MSDDELRELDIEDITLTLARCAVATGSEAARHQVIRLFEVVRTDSGRAAYAEKLRRIAAEGPSRSRHITLRRS